MAQTTAPEYQARTYGNYRRPQRPGIARLGLVGSIWLFVSVVLLIIALRISLIGTGVVLVVSLVGLAGFWFHDGDERSLLSRVTDRFAWWATKTSGAHVYRSGGTGRGGWGTHQLPGVAAQSQLSVGHDGYDRPFAMISYPTSDMHAVVLQCDPEGGSLVDHEQVDRWIAGYAEWLSMCGQEPGLVQVALTVEASPDSGAALRREIANMTTPESPAFAQQVMQQMRDTYPVGGAQVSVLATLTFNGKPPGGKSRPREEVLADVASRLPALTEGLNTAGASGAFPVPAGRLCEIVRVAYDPAAAVFVDEAHDDAATADPLDLALRAELEQITIPWSDVGPTASDEFWDHYRHDSAWSVTWEMTQPPRGIVKGTVLQRLLVPSPSIDRKRVTLLYRSYDPGVAAQKVEADMRAADFKISQANRPTARAKAERSAAQATADEEARGAGLVDFSMLVTASTRRREQLPEVRATMNSLRGSARVRLRIVRGGQASAFAAALPLGIVLPSHLALPKAMEETL